MCIESAAAEISQKRAGVASEHWWPTKMQESPTSGGAEAVGKRRLTGLHQRRNMTNSDDAIRDQATSHVESLLSELYEPEGVQIWMTSPQRWFGGRRAVDLIAEGRAEEVLAAIKRFNDGAWA